MDAGALRCLRELAPAGSRVVRARSERAFLRALPTATDVITWSFRPEWFARAPKLRLVATPAAGREFVPEKGPAGVRIHFGHYHGSLMAESVAAFALAWARGFFLARTHPIPAAERSWPRTWMSDKCYDLAGTRAVIVGFGHVGRAIGAKLEALGVEVIGLTRRGVFRGASARRVSSPPTPDVLRAADWLVMALPSTTGTDNWLDAAKLRRLPRRCVVMNVGRGNSVDERALYETLKTRRIAGAYLDVRKHEPSATVLEAKGFVEELADLPNCIIMPHASAFSPDYLKICFRELKNDRCF